MPPPALEVAIIGAGVSGICLGIKLKAAGIDAFAIFEKSDGVGGTWRDNTYPGANCDVPSLFYSFSFEFKTDWTRKFAGQAEILAYLEHCADKYGLRPHLRCNAAVTDARWDDGTGRWHFRTADGVEHRARVLVSGVGQLNRPAYPELPGLDQFAGTTFHSARWNHAHDLAGEHVAVIGNGASAIQFIPCIAPVAGRVTIFQRSANWMIPRLDRPYTERERRVFTRVPATARLLRYLTWAQLEARWPAFSKDSRIGRKLESTALDDMRRQVPDPALQAVLTPDYPVGCKRILISDDYYAAVVRPNVAIVTSPLTRVTRDALVTADGRSHRADTIIFATGFRTTEFLAPIHLTGRDGRTLEQAWRDGAEAYLGIALAGFPNFFMLYGPNTNLGHNSIIFMIERQVRLVMECVERLRRDRLRAVEVRREAMERYNAEVQRSLKRSVWDAGCQSWYKTASGKITNNWPHGTISYWWRTRRMRWADFASAPAGG
jgi:cation diffusion facilitator CzcD-associated flavoprotein CzcO